jgi:hypothetical protein
MGHFKYCNETGVLILKNLQLKVTPPNEFNDPFEFSPVVRNPNPKAHAEKAVKRILTEPELLKSVTFGLRTAEATTNKVWALTEKVPLKHLHIFKIKADENEFKLHRTRLK